MSDYPHLSKAPITEALVDIQVKLPPGVGKDELRSINASISEQYPTEQLQGTSAFTIKAGKTVEAEVSDTKFKGLRYISKDEKQILQARLDGFTFSRLHPYETWEELRGEALRLWKLYVEVASPECITRVAVRFINRLEIPWPIDNLNNYIKSPPTISPEISKTIGGYLTRIMMHDSDINANIIITQSFDPVLGQTPELKSAPLILDVDVYREGSFSMADDASEAWDFIEEMRSLKNKLFFESITEKTVELCK